MVGIFPRFSGGRSGHRQSKSVIVSRSHLTKKKIGPLLLCIWNDFVLFSSIWENSRQDFDRSFGLTGCSGLLEVGETVAPDAEVPGSAPPIAAHGIEVAVEFKPVEHPVEPLNHDQPVKCPLPEPSILNDGRIWKERISSTGTRMRTDLPVVKEGSHLECEAGGMKPHPDPPRRAILSSISAPEHNILALLEECNAAENQTVGE